MLLYVPAGITLVV